VCSEASVSLGNATVGWEMARREMCFVAGRVTTRQSEFQRTPLVPPLRLPCPAVPVNG
jgi:hypothetical protein